MADVTAAPHDFSAVPILKRDIQQYYASVPSFQAHLVADANRWSRHWRWSAVLLIAMLGASIFTNASMLPLKKEVPLFLVVREDGTVDTGTQLSDLGLDMTERVIRASIWRYVQERVSYSYSDARRRYDLVSLMSCRDEQQSYQDWFFSPNSPQKTFGKDGTITAQEISMSPVREGVFIVRLWKVTKKTGEKEKRISASATVEYVMLHDAPASLILDNPAALCVSRWQYEENAT